MQGHPTASPSLSPGVPSPIIMSANYTWSPPLTPGTVTSMASTAYSVGSRTKRLTRKLSFWKKSETSASDVRNAMRALQKSHQQYSAATRHALDTLHNWSMQLCAPPKFPREWQTRLASPELQELLLCVCGAMYPIYANEAMLTQIFADIASGFQSLSYYEENCKQVAAEVVAADRRYYQERRRGIQLIEAGQMSSSGCDAETLAAGKLAVYENVRLGLQSQMAGASGQYPRQCHTELPRQFGPILAYKKQKEEALLHAISTIRNAQLEYPPAEFENGRSTSTATGGLFTPRSTPATSDSYYMHAPHAASDLCTSYSVPLAATGDLYSSQVASGLTAPLRYTPQLKSMLGSGTPESMRHEQDDMLILPCSSSPDRSNS